METRQLGTNGPYLTTLGFGAWAIGGPWKYGWGPVDDNESVRAIHAALDHDINWIDTAAAYGFGHSEEVVAKAIGDRPGKVFVATKCGLVSDGNGDAVRDSRPEGIRKEIEGSLQRLRVECIDLYHIHWHDDRLPVEESWGTLVRLREEGKVRYIGVSNYDVPLLERCMNVAPVQSLQLPHSMLYREAERTTLPHCKDHGIGVIAYSPMQFGLLTGRFDVSRLAPDDWRRGSSMFEEPYLSHALKFVEGLRPNAAKYRKTVGELAVAWLLSHPALTSAIVGAGTAAQVEENIGAADWQPATADMRLIQELMQQHSSEQIV